MIQLAFKLFLFSTVINMGCVKIQPPEEYNFSGHIQVDDLQRSYAVHLPGNYYSQNIRFPLVIGLHGAGGSGAQFEQDYLFSAKADEVGFVSVYPDGIQSPEGILNLRTWNAGACCDYAMRQKTDDVTFISKLIDELSSRFRIDPKRIYVAGMSNGGMMAYRLAAELPHKIAAIASVTGTMVNTDNHNAGKVPVLQIHSIQDTKVPFNGGIGLGGYDFPPVMDGIHYWALRNGCDTTAKVKDYTNYSLREWRDASGKLMLECILTADGGHSWPGAIRHRLFGDPASSAIRANDMIWDFLNRYRLP